jgi:aminomethyltransferase
LGKPLGLGYVPVALASPGSEIAVEIRGQKVPARVVETPFYRRAK